MHKSILLIGILLLATVAKGQLISDDAVDAGTTEFGDLYFIFCAETRDDGVGDLSIESDFATASTFYWEKYDTVSNAFVEVTNTTINSDTLQSTILGLKDGCYRVTVESDGNSYTKQAWVLNNWIEMTYAEIPDSSSTCDGFKIWADYEYSPLTVYNTETGEKGSIRSTHNNFKYLWEQDGEPVSNELNPYIMNLIASETPVPYTLTISDDFGCTGVGSVDYNSKVPESAFTVDPMEGEAVLEATFTNSSINYDSTLWFFYKDDFRYSLEVQDANGAKVDSVDFVLYDDAPVYNYENSGQYRVKLVTVKINDTGNCRDTFYMEPGTYINVKESLVEIPNVFTPNGDGTNDVWMIKSQSLKSMNVKIYNRWGGLVYSWKYSNITSSDDTYEHLVWDGRIGKRMAAPGVYFYVVTWEGRDIYHDDPTQEEQKVQLTSRIGKPVKGTEKGFIHLFRQKQ